MIRQAQIEDVMILAKLAVQMWDEHAVQELADDFCAMISKEKAQFFIKYSNNIPVGFAQCQLRHDYVEGTNTTPVGYLEGIFVNKEFRHKGYAKELLTECENWAREKGCIEFASDCELDNEDSLKFHMKVGFKEANRVICFTKKLSNK